MTPELIKTFLPFVVIAVGAAVMLRRERSPFEVIFGFILILIGIGTHC